MRRLISILIFVFGSVSLQAQYNYKDTVRIVRAGDSHCGGANSSTYDSSWGGRFETYLATRYNHVVKSVLCTGGETTRTFMPGWSYQSNTSKNVDSAIRFRPDFVLIEYSGNDWVVQYMSAAETLNNLRFIHDTLEKEGIKLAMTGNAPRQKTFSGPVTQQSYKDTSLAINASLIAIYRDHYAGIWYPLLRADSSGKAAVEYLSADSLHFNNTGHRVFWESMASYPALDVIGCNCKGRALNFQMKKEGDSLRITADDIVGARVEVYGSDDMQTFSYITNWIMPVGAFDKKVYGNTYLYYQVRILSGFRPTITNTKRIN